MSSSGYMDDTLKEYLNKDSIEKAPAGFTSRAMSNIRLQEKKRLGVIHEKRGLNIPVISLLVTALFIMVAIFLPEKNSLPQMFSVLNISLPDPGQFSDLQLPSVIVNLVLGLTLLSLLDMVLHLVNRRTSPGKK